MKHRTILRGLGAVMTVAVAAVALGAPATALPVPSAVGVPRPPVPLFTEDFEHDQGSVLTKLNTYQGPAPYNATYTADPVWLTRCDGLLAAMEETDPWAWAVGVCSDQWSFDDLRSMASALATLTGGDANTNHALGEYTSYGDPGTDKVMLETANPLPLNATGRFITFSLDATAVNCQATHPWYAFSALDGASTIPMYVDPIDPCDRSGPATYTADTAHLFAGSTVGFRIVNQHGSGTGNDSAIDNVRVLDATPQLSRSPAVTVPAGGVATLTYTVTNTTERDAKPGWSFTDRLPAGVTVAGAPATTTTCTNGTVTAPAGGTSVSVSGDLAAGADACTVAVPVTAATAGTYRSCAANLTSATGVLAPGCASLVFAVTLAATGTAPGPLAVAGLVLLLAGVLTVRLVRARRP